MKKCSHVFSKNHNCKVGDVLQPLDQFISKKTGKETRVCLTCREHHNQGKKGIRFFGESDMIPGNPPIFENKEQEKLWNGWLKNLCQQR